MTGDDDFDLKEVWARFVAIGEREPVGTPVRAAVVPVAATLAEAGFRAECERRPVMAVVDRHPVVIYPIGTRPSRP